MSGTEQLSLKRTSVTPGREVGRTCSDLDGEPPSDREASARRLLRSQIARLERDLSGLVADGFPDIPAVRAGRDARRRPIARRPARAQRHQAGRELLAAMQLEPARYKFVRLRAVDVGQRGCGVWEVRPRLGVIGMLAGWWRVKLSSGCP